MRLLFYKCFFIFNVILMFLYLNQSAYRKVPLLYLIIKLASSRRLNKLLQNKQNKHENHFPPRLVSVPLAWIPTSVFAEKEQTSRTRQPAGHLWTLLGLLCVITAGVVKKKKKTRKILGAQSAESIVRHQLYSHHDESRLARSLAHLLLFYRRAAHSCPVNQLISTANIQPEEVSSDPAHSVLSIQ